VFDSPTTRGLFDPTTGFSWAADCFASLVPGPVSDSEDIDEELWRESFQQLNSLVGPWHAVADPRRYAGLVDEVVRLDAAVVASGHGVATRGRRLETAFDLLRDLGGRPPATEPGQSDLEAMLAAGLAAA
jgi:hypothetical protein